MAVSTQRPRKFENKARVKFAMEVWRDGEVVQRLDPTISFAASEGLAAASSCEALRERLRLDIETGDVVVLEARLKGIARFKRGELVILSSAPGGRVVSSSASANQRRQENPDAAVVEGLALAIHHFSKLL